MNQLIHCMPIYRMIWNPRWRNVGRCFVLRGIPEQILESFGDRRDVVGGQTLRFHRDVVPLPDALPEVILVIDRPFDREADDHADHR